MYRTKQNKQSYKQQVCHYYILYLLYTYLLYDIGTYDVINATAYPNGSSICVECVFSSAPSAKSCCVSVIGVTSKNKIL